MGVQCRSEIFVGSEAAELAPGGRVSRIIYNKRAITGVRRMGKQVTTETRPAKDMGTCKMEALVKQDCSNAEGRGRG